MPRYAKRLHTFTEAYLTSLKPEAQRYEVYDTERPGLVIRVTPNGTKTFALYYWSKEGKKERVTYQKFPGLKLKDARDQAKIDTGEAAKGRSPAKARRALRGHETLGNLWEKFIELHAKPRKRSWETDERRWKKHLAAHASERLNSITTPMVERWLSRISAGSGMGASNRVRAL
ncbi:MAG TPA: Arm DNA-binding domain-containing protein, partial [Thermoanaerobaculaceae bacterium]|nr:Arm DNA-binding domain-containing protein [Thermoanaerobaculaceae bacterium]